MQIELSGYDDKLSVLSKTVADKIRSLDTIPEATWQLVYER